MIIKNPGECNSASCDNSYNYIRTWNFFYNSLFSMICSLLISELQNTSPICADIYIQLIPRKLLMFHNIILEKIHYHVEYNIYYFMFSLCLCAIFLPMIHVTLYI